MLLGDTYSHDLVNSLPHYGVERALVSINGGWYDWTNNPAQRIESINKNDYLSSRYDIFTDVWPPTFPDKPWYRTEGYPDDVIVDSQGNLQKGWLAYINDSTPFQGYYTCSATHADYAQSRIATDLAANPYTARFIDVEQASGLKECYSEDHPTTRHEDALHRINAMKTVKENFTLVTGSEEAREWAFPYTDYGEGTMTIRPATNAGYDWANPLDEPGDEFEKYNMNAAVRIPLHGLVYHDTHIATWYTGDGQSKVPAYWDDKDLFNILYASMPLVLPPSKSYWEENREKYLTTINLVGAVGQACGFAQMTNHEFLTENKLVQKTEFDNGWQIIANFSTRNFKYDSLSIPPKGFWATDGDEKVYRINYNSTPFVAVEKADKLFINPYNRQNQLYGVRTSGSVVLQKSSEYIKLAFVGDQSFVDIKPDELPWEMEDIAIQEYTTGATVSIQELDDGFIRLTKNQNNNVYTLTGTFTNSENNPTPVKECSLQHNYPNPFNMSTTIEYSVEPAQQVHINIYDILGRHIKTLLEAQQPQGAHQVSWDGTNQANTKVSGGIYLVKMKAGNWQKIRKIVMVK